MAVAGYGEETEARMRGFFESLNENDRRRYAGLEASKLGHGGIAYISAILGCDRKTVYKGIDELLDPPELEPGRIRKKGAAGSAVLIACRKSATTSTTLFAATPPVIRCARTWSGRT